MRDLFQTVTFRAHDEVAPSHAKNVQVLLSKIVAIEHGFFDFLHTDNNHFQIWGSAEADHVLEAWNDWLTGDSPNTPPAGPR